MYGVCVNIHMSILEARRQLNGVSSLFQLYMDQTQVTRLLGWAPYQPNHCAACLPQPLTLISSARIYLVNVHICRLMERERQTDRQKSQQCERLKLASVVMFLLHTNSVATALNYGWFCGRDRLICSAKSPRFWELLAECLWYSLIFSCSPWAA